MGIEDTSAEQTGPTDFVVLAVRAGSYQAHEMWAISATRLLVDDVALRQLDQLGLFEGR